MKIILGSSSENRKTILSYMGYPFDVMKPGIDEKAIRSENIREIPVLIARAKAKALLSKIKEPALLITADQVVIWNGTLREKPESKKQAKEYLASYGEFPAETVSAITVTNTKTGKQVEGVDTAKVFFQRIPQPIIELLVAEGKVMDMAGGFVIEDKRLRYYIDKIEGTEDSILGLPIELTKRLMGSVGI